MKEKFISFAEKARDLNWWMDWIGIIIGCFIMSAGFVYFINPYNIIPGGVYGTSIVLHNLFPHIQVGTFGYMLDVPLMVLSILLLGSKLGARTILAVLVSPALMNILSMLSYPSVEALQALDPAQLLNGHIDMSDDLMLTTILGSMMIGLGCGIVVRCDATSGGSDIVAMICQKYLHIPFSKAILMVDGVVVLFGLLIIGMGIGQEGEVSSGSWLLSFYSLIAIFISSRTLAYVLNGSKDDKMIFIVSNKPVSIFREFIINDLDRTATRIKSCGLYSGQEKEMLFLIAKNKEVRILKHFIKEIDPEAFVVVTDAYDTYGEGWQSLPSKGDIQPE